MSRDIGHTWAGGFPGVAVEAQPRGLCRSGERRRGVWGRGHLAGAQIVTRLLHWAAR